MIKFIRKILFALIAIFCLSQAQAGLFDTLKGAAGKFDPIKEMMVNMQNGAKTAICKEGGVCRKFEGYACQFSKNLVSTCALMCANQPGFLPNSKCSQKAQKSFGFIPQTLSYTTGESAVDHLSRQLEKGPMGNNPASQQFFNAFCSVKGAQLIEPQYKQQVANACRVYKGTAAGVGYAQPRLGYQGQQQQLQQQYQVPQQRQQQAQQPQQRQQQYQAPQQRQQQVQQPQQRPQQVQQQPQQWQRAVPQQRPQLVQQRPQQAPRVIPQPVQEPEPQEEPVVDEGLNQEGEELAVEDNTDVNANPDEEIQDQGEQEEQPENQDEVQEDSGEEQDQN